MKNTKKGEKVETLIKKKWKKVRKKEKEIQVEPFISRWH